MTKKKKNLFKKKHNERIHNQSFTKLNNKDLDKENKNTPSKNNYKTLIGIKYVYITIFFVFLAGVFNPIIKGPAFTNHVIIAVLVLFLGLGGIVLVYKSKSYTSEKGQWISLAGGLTLMILSIILMFDVMGKSLFAFSNI